MTANATKSQWLGKTRRLTEAMDVILDIGSIRLERAAWRFEAGERRERRRLGTI
jgi:hypothetical protein